MDWKLKSKVFRALSVIPFGSQLHYQLQKHITKQWPRPIPVLDNLLIAARKIYQESEGHHGSFLEIGAGRDLAVAVALRLMGVRQVTCIDVSHLARPELIASAAAHMAKRLGVRVPTIRTWHDVEAFGISYLAPTTLERAALQPLSIDCFFSVDTLEHIPPDDLRSVLKAARRTLKSDGLGIHFIDYGDHYARGDDGLSRFNFLTYTQQAWRPFNSPFQYVNRLRHSDFLGLLAECGMKLISVEPDRAPPEPVILDRLAPEFRAYEVADLFTVRAMIVAGVERHPSQ